MLFYISPAGKQFFGIVETLFFLMNPSFQDWKKIEKKLVSTSQKISCALAIIKSFFENCSPPNSNCGFHLQKNSSDQKQLFPLDRKSISTSQMKDLLKNVFLLYRKIASTLKNLQVSKNVEKTIFNDIFCLENLTSLRFQ